MHAGLLDSLAPVCPVCRRSSAAGIVAHPLILETVFADRGDFLLEALLTCENEDCGRSFPVLDGVPVVVPDFNGWTRRHGGRPVLPCRSAGMRHWLAERPAPDDETDRRLATYLKHHYGTRGPDFSGADVGIDYWVVMRTACSPGDAGPWEAAIDLGCGVGRMTFELATASRIAVGLDLDFDAVRMGARLQREGRLTYRRPETASRWGMSTVIAPDPSGRVLFMVADALDPPFRAESFDAVVGLNILDNVAFPLVLLGQMDALLKPGGRLVVASPYHWNPGICSPGEWLESDDCGPLETLRGLLQGNLHPETGFDYAIVSETQGVFWPLRHHDRYWSVYRTDVIAARKNF